MPPANFPQNEIERLSALYRYRILDTPPDEAFDRITSLCVQLFKTPIALVTLVDTNRLWFKSCYGLSMRETSRDVAFCAYAIHSPELLVIPDARLDPRFCDNPLVLNEPYIRFYAGAPLFTNDGQALGTLCLIDQEPRSLSNVQLQQLQTLAKTVMDELELHLMLCKQSQTMEALSQQYVQTRLVAEISQQIYQSLNLNEILNTTVYEVQQFLQADRVVIYCFATEYSGAQVVAEAVRPGLLNLQNLDPCFQQGYLEQYKDGRILSINDITQANLPLCYLQMLQSFEVQAKLVLPIVLKEGVWGLLIIHQCSSPRQWLPSEIELLSLLSLQVAIAVAQSERSKEQQAREERDRLLAVIEAMRQAVGLQEILNATVLALRKTLVADRVVVYRFNDDWSGTFVAEAVTAEWKSLIDLHDYDEVLQHNISHCSKLILGANRPSVTDTYLQNSNGDMFSHPTSFRSIADIYQANFSECYIRLLEGYQTRAYMIMPLFSGDKLWGLLAVYQNTGPRRWKESEANLLYQVATQLNVPLQQTDIYQASLAHAIELENLVRLKDDFLSTVSHELRTPVSNMRLAIQMLKQTTDETLRKKYLAILESECDREKSLVNDLLDLRRFDSSDCPLKLEQVELGQWLPLFVAPFLNRANEREQALVIQVSPTLSVICTEIASFERIVAELLNNACKYTPADEQISFALRQTGDQLELTVSNTGAEIPQAELLHIFEKFYRIPNSDLWSQGGTGLGLALVQGLAKRLCGQILVKSENYLTTFTIMMPLDLSLAHCPRIGKKAKL